MFFNGFDAKGHRVIITEYSGTDTAQIKGEGIFGVIYGYRVDTSTYVGTDGVVYSNSSSKISANYNSATINWALGMLKSVGLMK